MGKKKVLYVVGQPGSGKTTALFGAIDILRWRHRPLAQPFWHEHLLEGHDLKAIYLGKRRGEFSGTDGLSMGVQPKVIQWIPGAVSDLLIGEGDRLANGKFFTALQEMDCVPLVIHLDTPDDVAADRRAHRKQNTIWIRGRQSKVLRLAQDWAMERIDGSLPQRNVARRLAELITNAAAA